MCRNTPGKQDLREKKIKRERERESIQGKKRKTEREKGKQNGERS